MCSQQGKVANGRKAIGQVARHPGRQDKVAQHETNHEVKVVHKTLCCTKHCNQNNRSACSLVIVMSIEMSRGRWNNSVDRARHETKNQQPRMSHEAEAGSATRNAGNMNAVIHADFFAKTSPPPHLPESSSAHTMKADTYITQQLPASPSVQRVVLFKIPTTTRQLRKISGKFRTCDYLLDVTRLADPITTGGTVPLQREMRKELGNRILTDREAFQTWESKAAYAALLLNLQHLQ